MITLFFLFFFPPADPQPDELQKTSDADYQSQEETIAMGHDGVEGDEGAEPEQMAITVVDVAIAKDEVSFDFLISFFLT